jgi:hypothetical protein
MVIASYAICLCKRLTFGAGVFHRLCFGSSVTWFKRRVDQAVRDQAEAAALGSSPERSSGKSARH